MKTLSYGGSSVLVCLRLEESLPSCLGLKLWLKSVYMKTMTASGRARTSSSARCVAETALCQLRSGSTGSKKGSRSGFVQQLDLSRRRNAAAVRLVGSRSSEVARRV